MQLGANFGISGWVPVAMSSDGGTVIAMTRVFYYTPVTTTSGTDTSGTDTSGTDTSTEDGTDSSDGADTSTVPIGVLENPGPSAKKSGIGIISGWACNASAVTVVIDGTTVDTTYGTVREDTESICGDTNNGFSALYNWNRFGPGTHTASATVDGVEFSTSNFTVSTFGTEFLTGATGTYALPNFPESGTTTYITWDQSVQNFVISDVQ